MALPERGSGPSAMAPRLRLGRATDIEAPGLLRLSLDARQVTAAHGDTRDRLAAWPALRTMDSHALMVRTTHVILAEVDGELGGLANLEAAAAVIDQFVEATACAGIGVTWTLLAESTQRPRTRGSPSSPPTSSSEAVRVFKRCGHRRTRTRVQLGN